MALHNSVAVAAAFTRDPRLMSDDDYYSLGSSGGSGSSGSGSSSMDYMDNDSSSHGEPSGDGEDDGGLTSQSSGGWSGVVGSSSGGSPNGGLSWPAPLLEWGSSLWGPRPKARLGAFGDVYVCVWGGERCGDPSVSQHKSTTS